MRAIKAVFFDIGNVLFYFSYEKMCREVGRVCGVEQQQIHDYLITNGIGALYERGEMSTEQLCEQLVCLAKSSPKPRDILHALSDIFEPNLSVYPLVHELKASGIRTILLSNTCEAHIDHLKSKYEILHHFDGAILSYEVKARKPEKAIFSKAIEMSGFSAKECFYTDDIMDYIEAAKQIGIDAEQFRDAGLLRQQLKARGIALGKGPLH